MEKLPEPDSKILARTATGCSTGCSIFTVRSHSTKGPWRPLWFDNGPFHDNITDWVLLPTVDDKRWHPYRFDTKRDQKVLCIGKFVDSPNPNIHIDSNRDDPFPGFMGKMPPMWGVSHWMSFEEAFENAFQMPKSFSQLPTQHAVEEKRRQQEDVRLADEIALAIINDGLMYKEHFSVAADGALVNLGRARRSIIGWRTHTLKRGFYHWVSEIIQSYNAKHKICDDCRYSWSSIRGMAAYHLLDHYENIAIESMRLSMS